MKLYSNWREILRKAWSIRLAMLATVFSVGQAVVPIFGDALPREAFAILTVICTVGVIVARLVWQQEV